MGENKTWTSVLGSKTLSRGSVYEFEFFIIQSTYFSFKIGVCDKKRAQR